MTKEMEERFLNAKKGEITYEEYLQAVISEWRAVGMKESDIEDILKENEDEIKASYRSTEIDEKTHSTYYSSVLDISYWLPML